MFKFNNKNTKTTSMTSFRWFYCQLWTCLTRFYSVSIVEFEQVIVSWEYEWDKKEVIFVLQNGFLEKVLKGYRKPPAMKSRSSKFADCIQAFLWKGTPLHLFSCWFCKIFQNNCFSEDLHATTSVKNFPKR